MKNQLSRALVVGLLLIGTGMAPLQFASGQDVLFYHPDGNLTSCNKGQFPFMTMGDGTRFQVLVPASHLGGKPCQVKEMAFSALLASQTYKMNHLQIRFAHTSKKTSLNPVFANNLEKDLTVVHNRGPVDIQPNVGKWTPVGLTRSFVFNGRDNVVVEIRFKTKPGAPGGFVGCGSSNVIVQLNRYRGGYDAAKADGLSMYPAGLSKIRFTTCQVILSASGTTVRPGGKVVFSLFAPPSAGLAYQLGTSLDDGPIWLGSVQRRRISLTPDALLALSTKNSLPSVFVGYAGVLAASGMGSAAVKIPSSQHLIGLTFHTAFVTIDPKMPFSIRSISNAVTVEIK